jgi:transcriptional regulator with XRE-family HTH domain
LPTPSEFKGLNLFIFNLFNFFSTMGNPEYKPAWKRAYGITVKELREQLGLSREEFTQAANLSKGYINHLEDYGTPEQPRGDIYRRIAKALNLSPEELYKRFKQKQNELKRVETSTLQTPCFALPENIAPVRNWVGRSQELDSLKSQLTDPPEPSLLQPFV